MDNIVNNIFGYRFINGKRTKTERRRAFVIYLYGIKVNYLNLKVKYRQTLVIFKYVKALLIKLFKI